LLDAAAGGGGGARCFRCGGPHMQRDCTAAAPSKPCFLCGEPGHERAACPNALCFRCGRPGHQARACPSPPSSRPPPCLSCGRHGCVGLGPRGGPCEPGEGDMDAALCLACGARGHLCCAPTTAPLPPPSCFLCGGGHEADECRRGRRL
jgi:cellular nucleic acid-binding protein